MIQTAVQATQKHDLIGMPEPDEQVAPPVGPEWWFTTAAYVLAVLGIAFAPSLGATAIQRGFAAVLLMLLSFAVVWLIRQFVSRSRRVWTRWIKGRHYDRVYEIAAQNRRGLEASQSLVRQFLSELPSYSGISHSVYRGRVFLELSKSGRRALPSVGRRLTLFDSQTGVVVGTFKVTSSDGTTCQLEDCGDIDSLFAGYAHTADASKVPEGMVLIEMSGRNDRDE